MIIGVVSDTHNNYKNINKIVSIFNNLSVEMVVHTGDITNIRALDHFKHLNCRLVGVFGNNDRFEKGLEETALQNNFDFKQPPSLISRNNRNIAIFHEPDSIDEFLVDNKDVDIVLHGHTHRYRKEILNQTLVFNPGESAGMVEGKNSIGLVDLKNLNIERIFF